MIPKVIHYCWFGGNPLPELAVKCIESWKKYLPDYEIKEWNDSNWDYSCCDYVKEAYQAKKWAFVSDYARFDILYKYGGLYFDTDVEIIKSFDQIMETPFMGCERDGSASVAPGLGMGAEPQMQLYKEVIDDYHKSHFLSKTGIDTTTVCERVTGILEKNGYKRDSDICEINGIKIYPWEYFCPMSYSYGDICITDNTYTIHWYDASWKNKNEKYLIAIQRYFSNKGKIFDVIGRVLIIPFKIIRKISNT